MKQISLIVAASANNVIGVDGGLPWHLPEDLRRFKEITMGKPMIMGRATWESIGRALPGRTSIVVTRQPDYEAQGAFVVDGIDAAIEAAGDVDEIMVIGGGEIYRQVLARADRIYMTRVHAELDGDTRFPALDMADWSLSAAESFPAGEGREFGFDIQTLDRRSR